MVQGAAVGGIYNGAEGAHRNLLNPLNPLNLLNPRAKGASIKLFFFLTKTILKFTDMHDIILSES